MKKFFVLLCAVMLVMGLALSASAANYYKYADFTGSDGFLGGYDVDSYENYLYVNHGDRIDRYTVSTAVNSNPSIPPDENTHPSNVGFDGQPGVAGVDDDSNGTIDDVSEVNWFGSDDNVGTMAARTLTYDATYSVSAIGNTTRSEIYATAAGLYFLDDQSDVSYYDFTSNATSKITAASSTNLSQLGRRADGTWIASNEQNQVYEYNTSTNSWHNLFTHTNFAGGGHLDGLEVASMGGTEYIFISDMYADNIGRYDFSGNLLETYDYPGSGSSIVVEGMGFGANDHLWVTGSGHLYELGGGALDIHPDPVPEPSTILLMGIGLLGLVGYSRKKKSCKN